MSERDVFEKMMSWMGMEVVKTKQNSDSIVVVYEDIGKGDSRFTTMGYDEFYAGAMFNSEGEILLAYIDSHVVYCSKNKEVIRDMIYSK